MQVFGSGESLGKEKREDGCRDGESKTGRRGGSVRRREEMCYVQKALKKGRRKSISVHGENGGQDGLCPSTIQKQIHVVVANVQW